MMNRICTSLPEVDFQNWLQGSELLAFIYPTDEMKQQSQMNPRNTPIQRADKSKLTTASILWQQQYLAILIIATRKIIWLLLNQYRMNPILTTSVTAKNTPKSKSILGYTKVVGINLSTIEACPLKYRQKHRIVARASTTQKSSMQMQVMTPGSMKVVPTIKAHTSSVKSAGNMYEVENSLGHAGTGKLDITAVTGKQLLVLYQTRHGGWAGGEEGVPKALQLNPWLRRTLCHANCPLDIFGGNIYVSVRLSAGIVVRVKGPLETRDRGANVENHVPDANGQQCEIDQEARAVGEPPIGRWASRGQCSHGGEPCVGSLSLEGVGRDAISDDSLDAFHNQIIQDHQLFQGKQILVDCRPLRETGAFVLIQIADTEEVAISQRPPVQYAHSSSVPYSHYPWIPHQITHQHLRLSLQAAAYLKLELWHGVSDCLSSTSNEFCVGSVFGWGKVKSIGCIEKYLNSQDLSEYQSTMGMHQLNPAFDAVRPALLRFNPNAYLCLLALPILSLTLNQPLLAPLPLGYLPDFVSVLYYSRSKEPTLGRTLYCLNLGGNRGRLRQLRYFQVLTVRCESQVCQLLLFCFVIGQLNRLSERALSLLALAIHRLVLGFVQHIFTVLLHFRYFLAFLLLEPFPQLPYLLHVWLFQLFPRVSFVQSCLHRYFFWVARRWVVYCHFALQISFLMFHNLFNIQGLVDLLQSDQCPLPPHLEVQALFVLELLLFDLVVGLCAPELPHELGVVLVYLLHFLEIGLPLHPVHEDVVLSLLQSLLLLFLLFQQIPLPLVEIAITFVAGYSLDDQSASSIICLAAPWKLFRENFDVYAINLLFGELLLDVGSGGVGVCYRTDRRLDPGVDAGGQRRVGHLINNKQQPIQSTIYLPGQQSNPGILIPADLIISIYKSGPMLNQQNELVPVDQIYRMKIVLVGSPNVGKSSIAKGFGLQKFAQQIKGTVEERNTIAVDFVQKKLNFANKTIRVDLYDTAGSQIFKSIRSMYYQGAVGALLVYDVSSEDSFYSLQDYLNDIKEAAHEKIKIMLVGNKIDLKGARKIDTEEGRLFAEANDLMFWEVSAWNGENVEQMFTALIEKILEEKAFEVNFRKSSQISVRITKAVEMQQPRKCCP